MLRAYFSGERCDRRRVYGLRVLLALAFLWGIYESLPLWRSTRLYPLAPVVDIAPIPARYDLILPLLLCCALVLLVALRYARWPLLLALASGIALLLLDQSRWQPWVYQYIVMFAVLAAVKSRDKATENMALNACGFLIVADYIWSGLAKLNPGFRDIVFPWFIEPVARHLPPSVAAALPDYWYLAALGEALLGVLLIFPRTRPFGVAGAFLMHALILYCLGPLGLDWNSVVWPWNVAMPLFVLFIFTRGPQPPARTLFVPGRSLAHAAVLLLFGLLPALSFFTLWDEYLSCSLYSGNVSKGVLHFGPAIYDRLPDKLQELTRKSRGHEYSLDIYNWSFTELNVPAYPERRVFVQVAREVYRRYAPQGAELRLVVHEKAPLFAKPATVTLNERLLDLEAR